MNEDTKQYWPSEEDFVADYQEEEFSIDQEEQFDVVRANIGNDSLNRLIRRACEFDMLPPAQKKWTLKELDFIEETGNSAQPQRSSKPIWAFSED